MSEEKRYGGSNTGKKLPGQGDSTRIGGSNTGKRLPGEGSSIRYGGSGGSSGGNGGNIFKNFGDDIGRNPLGAISNILNDGINDPMANLYKGQTRVVRAEGQYYQAQTTAARNQGNYYAADAKRDVYRDNRDGLYNIEAAKLGRLGDRYGVPIGQQNYGVSYSQAPMPGFGPAAGQGYGNAPQYIPYGAQVGGSNGAYWAPPAVNQPSWAPASNTPVAPVPSVAPVPVAPAVAPATVAAAPAVAPTTAPVTATPQTAAPATSETPAAVETKPAVALADAQGGKTKTYRFKAAAPKAGEIPNIAENQVKPLQEFLIAAGVNVGPTGADGRYGPNTHHAIKEFASKLNPPITDLTSIDFTDKNDPEAKRFLEALGQGAPSKGPSAEDLAKQQADAAKAAADKAAADKAAADRATAVAAADARVPESVRHTVFDPRNIPALSQQQRYDLARHALHGLDELSSEKSRPNLERMHDKMDETVRWVNKHMGTNIPRPSPSDPLSDDAMYALGLRAAYEGKLSNARGELVGVEPGMTQAQMNHRAVEYIKALDRGVSREDPSRAIRKFEKEDMGRTGIEVDGLADPQMLEALRQAVAARNGLYTIASASPVEAPATVAEVKLPDSVVGGTNVAAAPAAAPVVPSVQTGVDGAGLSK